MFVNATVMLLYSVHIYINEITLFITSEEQYYYHQTNLNIVLTYKKNMFCNFVGKRCAYTIFIYQDICLWDI